MKWRNTTGAGTGKITIMTGAMRITTRISSSPN